MVEGSADPTGAKPPKPKRQMSEQQLANLAKGRAARDAKLAEKKRAEAEGKTLEDVARKYAPEKAEADEAAPEPPRKPRVMTPRNVQPPVRDEEDDPAPVEELADRLKMYSMTGAAVPPPETNRDFADGMTMEVHDFAGDAQAPKTIEDLFAIAPVGDGQYYISVDRRTPKTWGSVQCAGTQRSITRYMTREDFAADYGGGTYTLILYGPPRRGQMVDPNTGRPRVKALTPPITVTVPVGTYPPNLQAAILDDEHYNDEDSDMRYGPGFNAPRPGNGRPTTVADARMFEAQLSFEERIQQRNEERERELRQQASALPGTLTPMVEMMQKQNEQHMHSMQREFAERDRVLREQLARERAERERIEERAVEQANLDARRPSETTALGDALSKLLGVMKNDGTKGEEIARLTEAAAKDRERLMQQHQQESARVADTYERRAKDAEERADRRVKEAEERAEARIKEGVERSDRRVQEAKDDAKRQVDDVRTHLNARLEDERRNHDRDLAAKNDSWQARLENQKAMYENRISTLGEEIGRLRGEVERFRKEAEENKDLPTQIQRFTATAEAIGFSKDGGGGDDDEPKDWKSMLGRIGLDLVQQLPQLMESASNTVRNIRGQSPQEQYAVQQAQYQQMMEAAQAQPRALRGRDGAVLQSGPLPWGTEDGPEYMGVAEYQEPVYPVPPPAPSPHHVQAPPEMREAPPQAAPVPRPAPARQVPAPAPPPRPAPAPAAAPAEAMSISDEQILQFTPVLQTALEQDANPEEFAEQFVESVGPQMARQIAASITPQRIAAAVQRQPGGSQNPLVRRDGQKFLRELWDSVRKIAG